MVGHSSRVRLRLAQCPWTDRRCIFVRAGTLACASRGIQVRLQGHHAHAAHPEDGLSPILTMAELLKALELINSDSHDDVYMVTVTYAQLGAAPNYGIAPGEAVVQATLRTTTDASMMQLVAEVEEAVAVVCRGTKVEASISYSDIFHAVENTQAGAELVQKACAHVSELEQPMRWSEDFGLILQACGEGAFFLLGAGERPGLHTEGYDFNDELIKPGVASFLALVKARHSSRA
eukprot:m.294042 g.294042  ORF g.294042 m.294042 type:complete len:234 (+) comp37068_c0_seq1:452-1153(+)